MTYEAWRISYQSSEQAARAAYAECARLCARLEAAEKERDDLLAKIEAIEKQKPIAWISSRNGFIAKDNKNHEYNLPLIHASGAQPVPSVPEGISRVSPDFYWDSAKQHHIPTVLVEFEPVPVGSPNDAKGWQDRDRFAALTTGAKGK